MALYKFAIDFCLMSNNRSILFTKSITIFQNKPSRDGRQYVVCDLELWPIKTSFCAFL